MSAPIIAPGVAALLSPVTELETLQLTDGERGALGRLAASAPLIDVITIIELIRRAAAVDDHAAQAQQVIAGSECGVCSWLDGHDPHCPEACDPGLHPAATR